jgi:arsenite methyltransferase
VDRITARRCDEVPYADGEFATADALQVLEYVRDVPGAVAEVFRVLRPGGRFAVLNVDWDSIVWHVPDRALNERVLEAWNAHCADPCLPRSLAGKLTRAGLPDSAAQRVVLFNPEYDRPTYSPDFIDLYLCVAIKPTPAGS